MSTPPAPGAQDPLGKIPGAVWLQVRSVVSLTDDFCADYLDEDYAGLCRKVVGRLARKRPSPLLRGDLRIWAGGALHVVGGINFLFDPSQKPHMTAEQLSLRMGVARSTMAAKSRTIRDALKLRDLEPDFCRRELLADHPWAWFVEIDGLIVDARRLPAHVMDAAYRKGLIPDPALLGEVDQ
jgi:hypothetical protein